MANGSPSQKEKEASNGRLKTLATAAVDQIEKVNSTVAELLRSVLDKI
jgi:hypothetical protein